VCFFLNVHEQLHVKIIEPTAKKTPAEMHFVKRVNWLNLHCIGDAGFRHGVIIGWGMGGCSSPQWQNN